MADFLRDYLTARAMRNNPALFQQMAAQQKQVQEYQQSQELSKILEQSIGYDPTGAAQQQQNRLPSLPIERLSSAAPTKNFGLYHDHIVKAANETGLSPEEIYQIMLKESGGNPNAVSPTGPQGLMQLSKAAAIDAGIDPNARFNPEQNITGGARYYAGLKNEFGPKAHLAYHDGPGAVRSGNISPAGRQYASSFNTPLPPTPDNEQQTYEGQGQQAYAGQNQPGSMFMQNPMQGGSGLLGQDMDPVRRSYLQMIKSLASTGSPMGVNLAMELLKEMQQSSLRDIERPSDIKTGNMIGMPMGSPELKNWIVQKSMRPQTQINMGKVEQPMSASDAMHLIDPTSGAPAQIRPGMSLSDAADKGYVYGQTLGATEATHGATSVLVKDNLNRLGSLMKQGIDVTGVKGFVEDFRTGSGAASVATNWALDTFGYKPTDAATAEMLSLTKAVGNQMLHALRGAQVGPAEQEEFVKQLPVPGQPKEVFEANYNQTVRNLDLLESKKKELQQGTVPTNTGTQTGEQDFESYYNSLPSGAKYTAPDGKMRIKK